MAASLLTLDLLYKSGLLSDFLDGSMLVAYFSKKLLRRLVFLHDAEACEFCSDRRFVRRLLNRRHERLCHFGRDSGRRKEAEPGAEQVLTIAQLGQGWDLRIIREL